MTASIRSSVSTLTNAGADNITVELPPVIEDGDLLIVAVMTSTASAYLTDDGFNGWWSLGGLAVNSRAWKVVARVYDSNDAASVYTLAFNQTALAKASALAVKDHAVVALEDIQRGTTWIRQEHGDSQPLVVAPGITTVEDDTYVLAFTGEATNAAGSYSTTTQSGFSLLEDTGETTSIEWITIWGKDQDLIGATGNLELTYESESSNGVGIQYAIPSGVVVENPTVRENLLLTPIPGGPGSGTPWNATGWATPNVPGEQGAVESVGFNGLNAYEMTYTDAKTGGGSGARVGNPTEGSLASVLPGETYTASGYIELNEDDEDWLARIVWFTAESNSITGTPEGPLTFIPADIPTRVSVTATAPETAAYAQISFRKNNIAGTGVGFRARFSAPLFEVGSELGSYFDGNTTDTEDVEYSWSGAVNGSTSFATPIAPPSEDPAVGNIGLHLSTNVLDTSLVVGFKRLQGSVVRVFANGGNAATAVVDTESDWGYAALTGLNRATLYSITFEVDGVVQTDTQLEVSTRVRPGTPSSYVMVAGSCQFTGSNHPVWDRIVDDNPIHLAHMGDLHYEDATTPAAWRAGVESSMTAPRFQALLESAIPISWTWDNHDRIILDEGGPGGALNLGATDPATAAGWKMLAGQNGWASPDTVGTSWVIGRVRYIQTDHWTARDDPDAGSPSPLTFMGDTQKQWFKNTLTLATEPVIVWLCQWTGQNHANGRWNSFPDESTELEQWIEARPTIKDRMVMIGADSHSLQVTDGTRTAAQGQRFAGIPNYNISGFNRSGETGAGGEGWLVDEPLRTSGQPESDWGGYSRVTVTDNTSDISLLWEGVRVDAAGLTDIMASQTVVFDTTPPPVSHSTLKWDLVGERRYETGVDQGVLYIPNASGKYVNGYAWNGLVSISESPSGAEGNKQYADNLAYLNLISEEEFSATIEAFAYPNEFGQCDGTAEVVSGIQMGQQARKSFGMSYRTKIGTDLNPDQGYKIHLIYNAMAAPTEKAYATVNDSPEAITFSWELSTTPTAIGEIGGVRYRPTATITVDSTKVDPVALANLETVLYGTELIPAALPSPAEVVMLLS